MISYSERLAIWTRFHLELGGSSMDNRLECLPVNRQFTFLAFQGGYDSSVHMSEEASNAAVAIPWAIVSNTGK